jgi:hypothetical protein
MRFFLEDISHGLPFAKPMKIYAGEYKDISDASFTRQHTHRYHEFLSDIDRDSSFCVEIDGPRCGFKLGAYWTDSF